MAADLRSERGLGTRLRHILEILDADVTQACRDLGLVDYRTRFSPFIRAIRNLGPSSVRDLARAVVVTHSAASQTVAQMSRSGYVRLEVGVDARQRIVHLTAKTQDLLPAIEAEWVATATALETLETELPFPITRLVDALAKSLRERTFRQRIGDAARTDPTLLVPFRIALSGEVAGVGPTPDPATNPAPDPATEPTPDPAPEPTPDPAPGRAPHPPRQPARDSDEVTK